MSELHRGGVGDAVVASGVRKPDGIAGRNRIEVGCVNIPMLSEFAFVPAVTLNPLAWFGFCDAITNRPENLSDTPRMTQIHGINGVNGGKMKVRVDQARRGSESMEVDDVSGRRGVAHHCILRADGKDFAVANGDSFGDRIAGIDGDELAVCEDGVCLICWRSRLGLGEQYEEKD